RRPIVPADCQHNAHMFYMLLPDLDARTRFISEMKNRGVQTVFHYIPLHSAPAGLQAGRTHGELHNTDALSERLVRMPLWVGVEEHLEAIFAAADDVLA
ncbi:DegT/DnrJ/EryC1/StrS family aminotransferase, partial [Stutzerimonas stutzeri]